MRKNIWLSDHSITTPREFDSIISDRLFIDKAIESVDSHCHEAVRRTVFFFRQIMRSKSVNYIDPISR
jgi:hypothetical protein